MVERVKKEVEIHCTLRHPLILEVYYNINLQPIFHLVICITALQFL